MTGILNRPWLAMPPLNRAVRGLAACGAVALGLAWSHAAQALPDAKVDQQIRPNFNLLLTPPLRHTYRPEPWRFRRGYPDYYPGRHRPLLLDSITVDCADPRNGPSPLNEAIYNLADNGILYIRTRGGAVCHETLEIDHPVIIAGEAPPAFDPGPEPGPAKLQPAPGAPCVRIAPGVKGVELRDLNIDDTQGGRSACIESVDADVALIHTLLRYQGDASAIFVQGGKFLVRSSTIDARTNDAAVLADGATVDFHRVKILADVRGLDITPAIGQSKLVQVGVIATGVGLPGSTGVTVRDQRSGSGDLLIANSVFRGWVTGLYVDRGGKAELANSRMLRTERGVVSDFGVVKVYQNAIESGDFGGYFSGSGPQVLRNRFYGSGPRFDPGANPVMESNYLFLAPEFCGFPMGPGLYCRPLKDRRDPVFDEGGFDLEGRIGWDFDGYEQGYARDGAPIGPSWTPPRKRCHGFFHEYFCDRDRDRDRDRRDDRYRDDRRDRRDGGYYPNSPPRGGPVF